VNVLGLRKRVAVGLQATGRNPSHNIPSGHL